MFHIISCSSVKNSCGYVEDSLLEETLVTQSKSDKNWVRIQLTQKMIFVRLSLTRKAKRTLLASDVGESQPIGFVKEKRVDQSESLCVERRKKEMLRAKQQLLRLRAKHA